MSQRVALVTGSATGVGRAVALRFARQGLAVAVNYSKSEKEAQETIAEVKKLGVPAILCQANVGDQKAVDAMIYDGLWDSFSQVHMGMIHSRFVRSRPVTVKPLARVPRD